MASLREFRAACHRVYLQRLLLGFRVQGIGLRVQGIGFRVEDLEYRV